MRLKVRRDRQTGLLACPLCRGDKAAYFFTPEDLIAHLLSHVRRTHAPQQPLPSGGEEDEGEL